jgi:hypothetical protein
MQISAVLSATVRACGLHNDRGRRQALRRGLSGGAPAAARFLAASNQADFILAASEFPLWFHHTRALSPASATKAASPLECSAFTTPGESTAAARRQRRAQRPFPMALLAAASQRGLPLVLLSPMAYWVLTKR